MRTVWKFPLTITDAQVVDMPILAEALTVQFQGKQLCLWAKVDPNNSLEKVIIRIMGTGHPINDTERLGYIATFQWEELVFHVFRVL